MGAAAAASPRQQETFSAKSCRRGTAGSQPRGGPGRAGLRVSVSTLQRPAGSRREEPHREIPTAAALLCVCVRVSATPPGQCHGADNPRDPRPPVPPPPRVHAPGWLPRLRAALPTKRGETPTPRDRPSREGGGGEAEEETVIFHPGQNTAPTALRAPGPALTGSGQTRGGRGFTLMQH